MALQIISICQRFQKQEVLHNVSLNIDKGDCYGLLGHNGAGKTTILRTAIGLMKPTHGVVLIDDFNIHTFPREAHSRMGGLIESPCFNENWDGFKNLCAFARLQGFNRQQTLAESRRVLNIVEQEKDNGVLAHKKVREYSQGMKQRLGIAQALLGNPSYILLDEPMNGLDPQAMADIRLLIKRMTKDEDMTVVISSHNLGEISNLCNKIAILRDGNLLVEEPTERLLENEKNLYRLRVSAEKAVVTKLFNTVNISYQLEEESNNNDQAFLIDLRNMKPAELSRHLLDNKVDLLALMPCNPSLEDVYLKINSTPQQDTISSSLNNNTLPMTSKCKPKEIKAPKWAFLRGINYELTRLLSGFKIASLFLLPAVFACISIFLMFNEASKNVEKVGEEVFSTTQMTAFDGVGKGLQTGLPILMVLITCLASQSISGEQSKGTLRYLLIRPINRMQISLSKLSSLILICIFSYIILVVSVICISSYFFDFKDLSEILPNGKLFPLVAKKEMYSYLWPVLLNPILPLLSYTAMGFAIGSWIKNNVGAFASTLGAIVFIDIGRAIIPGGSKTIEWLPSAHFPSPFGGHSFLTYYCNMVQGVSNAANPYADLSVLAPLVWLILMMIFAMIALNRKAG
ncbi:MAG: ATP-binding cassette domain-containing protein [Sedimentisphaerales bacterium]|nr:ATP-binding cassette domain-containing protein [Sedimentisphaerales bacterium]